jgi:peptidoglycan endopeptidase LytF
MTRRDTIISAALVNTGLLVILFVCALGIDKPNPASNNQSTIVPSLQTVAETVAAKSQNENLKPSLPLHDISTNNSNEIFSLVPFTSSKDEVIFTVQKGDRLENLAKDFYTTVEKIVELNQLSTTQLTIGQKLIIPTSAEKLGSTPKSLPGSKEIDVISKNLKKTPVNQIKALPKVLAPKNSSTTNRTIKINDESKQYHYVQRGESPWVIAKKYNLSVEDLLKMNHLDEITARRLREGDRLKVR